MYIHFNIINYDGQQMFSEIGKYFFCHFVTIFMYEVVICYIKKQLVKEYLNYAACIK